MPSEQPTSPAGVLQENEGKGRHATRCFRRQVESMQNFFSYFMRSQAATPWRALFGPGPSDHRALAFTHLWYLMILSFIPVCSLLADIGIVREYLANDSGLCNWREAPKPCESIIVVFITYRLGFAISVFFFVTAMLLIRTSNDRFTKTALHTGFWMEKVVVVLIVSCIAFAIPGGTFDSVWIFVLYLASFFVCLMQMFLILDAAAFISKKVFSDAAQIKSLSRKALKFFMHILPLLIGICLMASQLYRICTSRCQSTFDIVMFTMNAAACIFILLYIVCCRRSELLNCFTVICYVAFLSHVATTYRQEVCGLIHFQYESFVLAPNFHSIAALLLFYLMFCYALLRSDQPYYFTYGSWCVALTECSKESMMAYALNRGCVPRAGTLNGRDLNETLQDVESDVFESDSEYEKFHKTARNKPQDIQQGTGAPINEVTCRKLDEVSWTYSKREYSEAMILLLFFLASSHLTLTVTSWYRLELQDESEVLVKPVSSVVALHAASSGAVATYSWFVFVAVLVPRVNILSTCDVGKEFLKILVDSLSCAFYRSPKVFITNRSSRLAYTLFCFCCLLIACFILTPFYRHHFESFTNFCINFPKRGLCEFEDPVFVGIYHILATSGMFFLLLALLLHRVNSTTNVREVIHSGCWLSKALLLVFLFITLAYVPIGFSKIWLYLSLGSTVVYILIEIVGLLEGMNIFSLWLTKSLPDRTNAACSFSSPVLIAGLYVVSIATLVCCYAVFGRHVDCKVNRFFITLNFLLCVAVSIVSVHPLVKSGGLLRSSAVTSFCMYQTWSALTYNPKESCNPWANAMMRLYPRLSADVFSSIDVFFVLATLTYFCARVESIESFVKIQFPTVLFTCQCRSRDTENRKETRLSEALLIKLAEKEPLDEHGNIQKWLDDCSQHTFSQTKASNISRGKSHQEPLLLGQPECNGSSFDSHFEASSHTELLSSVASGDRSDKSVKFSRFFFHAVHFLASSYLFVLLTHWLSPVPGSNFKLTMNWAIMSVKIVASCVSVLFYLWTLVVPVLLDFYQDK